MMVLYTSNSIVLQLSVSYLNYYQYTCMLLYPFICISGLKEVKDGLKQNFRRWTIRPITNNNRIQPIELRNGSRRT